MVIDASAALTALVNSEPDTDLSSRVNAGDDLHAPHLIDLEFLNALRRLVRHGQLTLDRANDARTDFAELNIFRYPILDLADRVWHLRDSLSAYDAAYIALAEALDLPLITCDGKLGRANGHTASVELFPV